MSTHISNSDLKLLHIFTTSACNLRCIVCTAKDKLDIVPPLLLSPDILHSLVTDIKHPIIFRFTGGEPLVYFNDNLDVLDALVDNEYIYLSFISNGLLLSDEILERLKKAKRGFQFIFSIDGYEDVYEEMRVGAKWEVLVDRVDAFSEIAQNNSNVSLFFKYIMCNKTIYCLEEFVDFVISKKWPISHIEPNKLLMDSKKNNTTLMMSKKDVEYYKDTIDKMGQMGKFKLESNGDFKFNDEPSWISDFDRPLTKSICTLPFFSLSLYYDGSIIPCCNSSNVVLGNLMTEGIYDIWQGEVISEIRGQMLSYKKPSICLCSQVTQQRINIADKQYLEEKDIVPNFSKKRVQYITNVLENFRKNYKAQNDISILIQADISPYDKHSIPIYSELAGMYLYRLKDYNNALEICNVILKIYPLHYETKMKLGIINIYLEKYSDAFEILTELLKQQKEHNILYFWLGFCCENSGDSSSACQYYEQYVDSEENRQLWGFKHANKVLGKQEVIL